MILFRYGSSANLVLTTGNGVNGYTLDPSLGEFILTHPDIKIPPRGKIYSCELMALLASIRWNRANKTPL